VLNLGLLHSVLETTREDMDDVLAGPLKHAEGDDFNLARVSNQVVDAIEKLETQLGYLDSWPDERCLMTDHIAFSDGHRAATMLLEHASDPAKGYEITSDEGIIRHVALAVLNDLPIWEWEGFMTALHPVLHHINQTTVVEDSDDEGTVLAGRSETVRDEVREPVPA
jgi:hypothetical protein